jgi:ABC-type oligopeptide transport system ATPase subunit
MTKITFHKDGVYGHKYSAKVFGGHRNRFVIRRYFATIPRFILNTGSIKYGW